MPTEDGEIAEVTPMIVKTPKEPRDGSIDNSALAGLLAQGGKKLASLRFATMRLFLIT